MSPGSASQFARRAAPEPNKRALYVGGLDPRVTEDVLRQIFETTGHVQNVKIIPDKNVGAVSIKSICVNSLRILASIAHYFVLPCDFSLVHLQSPDTAPLHLNPYLQHTNRGLVSVEGIQLRFC